jgi:hypothetical protein
MAQPARIHMVTDGMQYLATRIKQSQPRITPSLTRRASERYGCQSWKMSVSSMVIHRIYRR